LRIPTQTFSFAGTFYFEFEVFGLSKTFVLNIRNLDTADDAVKIENYFMNRPGVEKVVIEMSLSIVSLRYNETIGSPMQILEAFEQLGYPVR